MVGNNSNGRPKKVVVLIGYFDTFSGYQEIGLARSLAQDYEVHVITSDQVNPIFTDEHLGRIGRPRRYTELTGKYCDANIIRLPSRHVRAMAFNRRVGSTLAALDPDIVIQMMPGQIMPSLATRASGGKPRAVIFGDNRAMWAYLSPFQQKVKEVVFTLTKGLVYWLTVRKAAVVLCYTQDTRNRLRKFFSGVPSHLLPLAFDDEIFRYDQRLRDEVRAEFGFTESTRVFLLVGKYKREKRFEEFIEAFGELRRGGSDSRLLVVGPSLEQLRGVLDSSSLTGGAVIVAPFADHARLNALMNAADVGIWPAMPAITIQQAMGSGLFVVINDDDLVGHLVQDDRVGMKILGLADQSPEQMAQALDSAVRRLAVSSRQERASINHWLSIDGLGRRVIDLLANPGETRES